MRHPKPMNKGRPSQEELQLVWKPFIIVQCLSQQSGRHGSCGVFSLSPFRSLLSMSMTLRFNPRRLVIATLELELVKWSRIWRRAVFLWGNAIARIRLHYVPILQQVDRTWRFAPFRLYFQYQNLNLAHLVLNMLHALNIVYLVTQATSFIPIF